MKFREHIPLYVLILLIIVCLGYSYARFMLMHDYAVAYEGTCDTSTQNCFVGCNDDDGGESGACADTYNYAKMQKYAPDLYAECGPDITDCEDANVCLPQDRACSVTYCDPSDKENTCSGVPASTPEKDPGL